MTKFSGRGWVLIGFGSGIKLITQDSPTAQKLRRELFIWGMAGCIDIFALNTTMTISCFRKFKILASTPGVKAVSPETLRKQATKVTY